MSGVASYSRLDRLLHHIAFKGIGVQKALADMEDRIFAREFADIALEKPVFITSLPRAGTTLLLEVMTAVPEWASHTYRDMPFVLCPLLWNRVSRSMRKKSSLRERAHGDGIQIGYDSPEAFEEILWKAFWKEKYLPGRILTWSSRDCNAEFEDFFRNHIRKLIALRSAPRDTQARLRYISKNNTNVARLEWLTGMFPDCRIVIPVRNPWDHTASLLQQHVRFTTAHQEDDFGRQYMEWLGHHEFGTTLRPIDFRQWVGNNTGLDPADQDFWLTYWVTAYESILAAAGPNVIFIDYDRLCAKPEEGLSALAVALKLENPAGLLAQASRFRRPTRYGENRKALTGTLDRQASQTYDALLARQLIR